VSDGLELDSVDAASSPCPRRQDPDLRCSTPVRSNASATTIAVGLPGLFPHRLNGGGIRSDLLGQLGERSGNSFGDGRIDGDFVVSAAKVLQKVCPAMITIAVQSVCNPCIG
jgi:hypothetical protein